MKNYPLFALIILKELLNYQFLDEDILHLRIYKRIKIERFFEQIFLESIEYLIENDLIQKKFENISFVYYITEKGKKILVD